MNSKYPGVKFSFANSSNLKSAKDVSMEMDKMLTLYPNTSLKRVNMLPFKGQKNTYAHTVGGHTIEFNTAWFGNHQRISDRAAIDERIGWHPKGTGGRIGSIATHEFGHVLSSQIRFGQGTRWMESGTTHGTLAGLRKKHKISDVSRYAKKNPEETFAEAFASMHWTPKAQQGPIVAGLKSSLKSEGWYVPD
jgi:hypothetical protein